MNVQTCKEGGAAFPHPSEQTMVGYEGTQCGERGMTLRQYYAGKALQAILSHEKNILCLALHNGSNSTGVPAMAKDCFIMADAMLATGDNPPDIVEVNRLRGLNDRFHSDLEWRREIGAVTVFKDGDQWCAVMPDFINLQESVAGFGKTVEEAIAELRSKVPSK